MVQYRFISLLFALQILCGFCELEDPIVKTVQGSLKGRFWVSKKGRTFNAFLGIPFAKPPLGELRFQPPVPHDSWEGLRDATKIHAVCPQRDIYRRSPVIEGEEDCLYLNVYTPQLPGARTEPLPVMIFFHGGGFLCGGGNAMWYGPDILLDKDVVLVVTNYRLGALGFLSTGDEVVPGNNGLKDQNLAMKWVRDNIKEFGGDPNRVTLFGESAGGASVHLHMLSPLSKGLFRAGISQSGTALNIWAVAPGNEGVENSRKLAELLKCPTECSKAMVECLRKIDPYNIVEQDIHFMGWDFDPMIPFKPVVEPKHEEAFLTKKPIDIIKSGESADIPWIIGLNTEDGALRAAGLFGNPHLINEINQEFERVIPISLLYDKTAEDIDYVTNKIKKFYFDDKVIDNSSKAAVIDMYTDSWFLSGIDQTIRLYRKHYKQPIYYYLFGHKGVASFTAIFGDPENEYGVCHADDLQYLFPVGDGLFPDKPPSEDDIKVRDIMTTLWANLATHLNPTPEVNDLIPEHWQPVQSDKMEYYFIHSKKMNMKNGLFKKRVEFWRTLPIYGKRQSSKHSKEEL